MEKLANHACQNILGTNGRRMSISKCWKI